MSVNLSELRELLAAINQTDIEELTLKSDDFELTVRRNIRGSQSLPTLDPSRIGERSSSGLMVPPNQVASFTPTAGTEALVGAEVGGGSISAPPPTTAVPPPSNDRRLVEITSPMVGTFYRSPAPDELPFVDVGDRIRVGQTVCIIEAMKLMNELEAEVTGEIVEIVVQNGEPVEYGQVLMRVNPG